MTTHDPDRFEDLLGDETPASVSREDERSGGARRLLLVCMHFARPRHTGGVRWRAMARDLPRLGWEMDVLAADPRHAAERFPSDPPTHGPHVHQHLIPQHRWDEQVRLRLRDAWWALRDAMTAAAPASDAADAASAGEGDVVPVDPESVPVWKLGQTKAPSVRLKDDLVGAAELMRDLLWTVRALRTAHALARTHTYRAVIVTSPVHVTHWVGVNVAQTRGLPYVADFRDPMYYGRREDLTRVDDLRRLVWRSLETRMLQTCHCAVDIAEGAQDAVQDDLARRGRDDLHAVPRHYIPNGYNRLDTPPSPPDDTTFRVAYTGSLLNFMDVRPLFEACGRLATTADLSPDRFRIQFMGTDSHFNGVPLRRIAAAYGVEAHFDQYGRRPPDEADALQERAAVLVAYDSVCTHGVCIPTKLYFYARTRGELLLIGRPGGALAREAAKIDVPIHAPDDTDRMFETLRDAYRTWKAGGFDRPLDATGTFDSRRSSIKMHNLLTSVPAPRRA